MTQLKKVSLGVLAIMLAWIRPEMLLAQEQDGLTEQERLLALEIEDATFSSLDTRELASVLPEGLLRLKDTPAGERGQSTVTAVTLLGSPATSEQNSKRRAMVTRFDYRTGYTLQTTVDLEAQSTIGFERKLLYPTPLAASERDRALELARAARSDWQRILKGVADEEVELIILVPVDSDRRSPTFGHRLVRMRISQPQRSSEVLVDLSREEVVEQ